jgi:hypothetical protein
MADTFSISRTGKATILKDPNALLDYTFDWTDWLTSLESTDAIVSVDFDIDPDTAGAPTVEATQIVNGKLAVAWVLGGTPAVTYSLRCRITTSGGRVDDRTVYLKIKER